MNKILIGELIQIDLLIWFAGILNIIFLLPQAITIIKHKSSKNVSIMTYVLALFIQIVGAIAGWIYNISGQMWTLGVSALVSTFIIFVIIKYKK